jgi:hypothetical protein
METLAKNKRVSLFCQMATLAKTKRVSHFFCSTKWRHWVKMSHILPNSVIQELVRNGATMVNIGIPLYQLGYCDARDAYFKHLEAKNRVDVLLIPTFGDPTDPIITPDEQMEIHRIISCHQAKNKYTNNRMYGFEYCPLSRHLEESIAISQLEDTDNVSIPPGGIYWFNGEICSVQKEIAKCPSLSRIPFGNVVCNLVISYANCHVLHKIKKSVFRPTLLRTPRITSLVALESSQS